MEKKECKLIGLKLDLKTVEMIEYVMNTLSIRTYTQVLKYCLYNSITIKEYYNYAISSENINIEENKTVKSK